jgi:hypothetical protein
LFIRASLEAGARYKSCHAKAGMKLVLGPVFVESLWRGFTPDATVVVVDKLGSKAEARHAHRLAHDETRLLDGLCTSGITVPRLLPLHPRDEARVSAHRESRSHGQLT